MKAMVGQAALQYVVPGQILGVGSGSTVNRFIDALASIRDRIPAAVSSSSATTRRLQVIGIKVLDSNEVDELAVYVDGADEIDARGYMIKGGGGALTREKIIASMSRSFVCVVDGSKVVKVLGAFPLPVEVVPMACRRVMREFAAIGGQCELRQGPDGPLITDNGQQIIDVRGLRIDDPLSFESVVNQWPGVVTVGVFARQKATLSLQATPAGVRTVTYGPAPGG